MSTSPSDVRIPLSVHADSPATEIFVIDHTLQRRAAGLGTLETELAPGYYKIRFRAAGSYQEKLVELSEATGPVTVHGETVDYRSSVPIMNTSTSRETHAYPAEQLSHRVHRHLGSGSGLFVFARDLMPDGPRDAWRGVSVHHLDGTPLADLADGDSDEEHAFAGLGLELDPGTYRLRVDTEGYGVYEMFLVTCPGWQTQVFGLAENFVAQGEQIRRMALRSVSVLMARLGVGFHHDSPELRLADMARLGLREGRDVVRLDEMQQLLYGKFENPMLGIYGGHLLVAKRRNLDHELVETVMGNLLHLLGPHPDVLALHLRPGSMTPPKELSFPTPPMLKSSWDLILQGTGRRNSLVPRESLSDLLSDGMLTSAPWLLRRVPEVPVIEGLESISFSASKRLLANMATALRSGDVAQQVRFVSTQREVGFSPLERTILAATGSVAASEETFETGVVAQQILASTVLEGIDAPPAAIARSTLSALRKLDKQGVDVRTLGIGPDIAGLF